jgi:hypothetical protein
MSTLTIFLQISLDKKTKPGFEEFNIKLLLRLSPYNFLQHIHQISKIYLKAFTI